MDQIAPPLKRPRGRPPIYPLVLCERCGARFRGQKYNANRFCSHACRPDVHPPAFLAQARALWDAGLSMTDIGARLGVSKGVIAGLAYRRDFPTRSPTPRRFSADEDAAIEHHRIAGLTLGQIALLMRRRKSSVQMRLIFLARRDEAAIDGATS